MLEIFLFFIVLSSAFAGDFIVTAGFLFDVIVDQIFDLFFVCKGGGLISDLETIHL